MKKTACGKMKKWGLFLTVLVCCLFLGDGTRAEAASAKTKALKAYKSMLASKAKLEKFGIYRADSFAIAYIDNDNVPELIVNGADFQDTQFLFTYKNGKIKKVGAYLLQMHDAPPFVYYKKKGVFRAVVYWVESVSQEYYTLKNGKTNLIIFKFKNGYDKKENGWYRWYRDRGSKKISKAAFNKLLKKKTGNTKATIIKTYKANTAANRNKYLR